MTLTEIILEGWPVLLSVITLIITLSKQSSKIEVHDEKIKTLFNLYNEMNKNIHNRRDD